MTAKIPKVQNDEHKLVRSCIDQLDLVYGKAIETLYKALQSSVSVQPGISTHRQWLEERPELPDWERNFDTKYAHMYETIFGAANQYGLDQSAYLQAYLEACEARGGQAPSDLSQFLPWSMTSEQRQRLSKKGLDLSVLDRAVFKGSGLR
jgi:hypothetical protein